MTVSARTARLRLALALVAAALLVALAAGAWVWSRQGPVEPEQRTPQSVKVTLPALPNILRQIAPEEALKRNEERPFTTRPDSPADQFRARATSQDDLTRAIGCLAQAIYYEAGGEGVDGGRAVAQVVLNRVRHPGYPPSVCGTVYQGSERVTGCQFTFTCDGSLRRAPVGGLWSQAQRLAREAIVEGKVFGPVGHATHYHADYVLPYWADSLDKQAQLGRHIFYRLKGGLGSAKAFSQRHASVEPVPPSPTAAVVVAEAIEGAVEGAQPEPLSNLLADRLPVSPLPPPAPLKIDENVGELIAPFAGPAKPKPQPVTCDTNAPGRQFRPATANNVRSNRRDDAC